MNDNIVRLSVPAEARYARAVRMTAANLAVMCDMAIDDVEDLRIAAEEGFVLACSSQEDRCDISFSVASDRVGVEMSLGPGDLKPDGGDDSLDLVGLLLDTVCDDFSVNEGADGRVLRLMKTVGDSDGR